jgi:hypothetical protein
LGKKSTHTDTNCISVVSAIYIYICTHIFTLIETSAANYPVKEVTAAGKCKLLKWTGWFNMVYIMLNKSTRR